MDLDKYTKNPAESYLKSIKAKQSWAKYGNNIKDGMHHRSRIDKITGNEEDAFGLKEKTKRTYHTENNELSNTRLGKALTKIKNASLEPDDTIYMIVEEHPLIKQPNYFYGHLINQAGILGNFEYCTVDERFPEFIFVEDMHRESEAIKGNFAEQVFKKLEEKYKDTHKGIALLPVSSKLESFYEKLGFMNDGYIGDDKVYKKYF